MASAAWSGSSTAVIVGGAFDDPDPRHEELYDRLRQAPGEEAQQALAPPPDPPPAAVTPAPGGAAPAARGTGRPPPPGSR